MSKHADTKEIILNTSSNLFHIQGYNGTGLSQIIKESGAPRGSLYYHFPGGKEEIALEAIARMRTAVAEDLEKSLRPGMDVGEALKQHILDIADMFERGEPGEGVPIGLIASETSICNENLRLACKQTYQHWNRFYVQALEASGYSKERAEDLGISIHAMIEGAFILAKTMVNGEPLRAIARQMPYLLSKEKEER
ncbi:TetR/AcrR family transcriptional regulator [Halobacillus sp. ACCC02827]|uniref:TetR/AcrR family transcriptional regulator n=1 Tax=Bacillaceae TaxID=186817 RepID=UPI0002A503F6|nr:MULTISPECIES: TetR/AcrR family transcriptional regulator [Bacillaceae]ELK48087.1 TetR family transcriptional regulator [Halobacillus sp. BAB-2008]QHT45611.1 TetR/AcrR family transcriptional regulator [Bacillus sp. SB49]WJE16408.1 TetR/AcrR family transcriptional regulator [Halobacillus sp. ACCC02827]